MKRSIAVTLALFVSLIAIFGEEFPTMQVSPIEKSYRNAAKERGTIDTLKYNIPTPEGDVEKSILVYLPYGYNQVDKSRKYNVLYLAHGGGDIPGSFFSKERSSIPLNQYADHLIADGRMDPIIIVSATYYTPGIKSQKSGMAETVELCRAFNKEMRDYVIPAVGEKYNTHLRHSDYASITATRSHRAFAGFSMGSLTTWYQLAFDPDAFRTLIPLSGDLWIYENGKKQDAAAAANWLDDTLKKTPYRGNELNVMAYSGTEDIAYKPELDLIENLAKEQSVLVYSDKLDEGNLHFSVLPGGNHTYEYINHYLMDAMPKIWKKERTTPYWLGADISGTTMIESHGPKLYNAAGEERENTKLMSELGLNAVRLRVWVNPKGGFSGKEDVLEMAKRAKANGMPVMLTFHYSDSWADPAKQPIPKAWENYDYPKMKKAVAKHTSEMLKLLKENDIDVKWVQLGNETTNGMLWETGRASTNMKQYAGLTQAAYDVSKKIYPEVTCIVHLDCGMDINRYHKIFDGLKKYGTEYDMIGMSVYPYWDMKAKKITDETETINKVTENIKTLSAEYGKPVMIVETGYEAKRPNEGYAFMRKLIDSTKPLEQCHGIFYWAPELEGFYPLGAFDNHRPTKIMDAFTEAAYDLPAQDTTFYSMRTLNCQSENGLIRGELYLPYHSAYSENGKLPIVIMSHGFNGTYRETQKYAECLAKNGIAAYTFDFCGGSMHSRSEGSTKDMSVLTEQADLEAVTRMIERMPNINPDKMMLLGCSQGALVSTITAGDNPGKYAGLILIYPALLIPETADAMLDKTKDTPEEYEFWGMKMSQKYYRQIKGINALERLKMFDKPVLVVYGEDDPITSGDTVEDIKSTVSKSTIHMIKDGKHGFPDPFNHRLSETYVFDFVKEILNGTLN